jgi:anti-sigma B factor antagonist
MVTLKRLDVNDVGDVTVVRFCDQKIMDDVGIHETGRELFRLVEEEGRRKVLLNLASVGFMSSAALGKLITLNKQVKGRGGALKMCNIRPEVREVFAVTRLDRLFDIQDDEPQALASF